jgi:hypothetical protein
VLPCLACAIPADHGHLGSGSWATGCVPCRALHGGREEARLRRRFDLLRPHLRLPRCSASPGLPRAVARSVSLGFGLDGKRIRRKVSGRTKTEVKDKLQFPSRRTAAAS